MSSSLYQGASSYAEALSFTCTPANGENFALITSALFEVKYPNGTVTTWTATLSAQSGTSITLTHVFLAGETDLKGNYILVPKLANSAGLPWRCVPKALAVADHFQT